MNTEYIDWDKLGKELAGPTIPPRSFGRAQNTEHPTFFYSGSGGARSWVVARHVVCITRIQMTVWLELPREARPMAVEEVPQDGLASILMVQPLSGTPEAGGTPGAYRSLDKPGFHGFLFVLIGDPMEEAHCAHPLGLVKAVPRFTTAPATYAVFYLGVSETLPRDNDLAASPGSHAPAPGQ